MVFLFQVIQKLQRQKRWIAELLNNFRRQRTCKQNGFYWGIINAMDCIWWTNAFLICIEFDEWWWIKQTEKFDWIKEISLRIFKYMWSESTQWQHIQLSCRNFFMVRWNSIHKEPILSRTYTHPAHCIELHGAYLLCNSPST